MLHNKLYLKPDMFHSASSFAKFIAYKLRVMMLEKRKGSFREWKIFYFYPLEQMRKLFVSVTATLFSAVVPISWW